MTLIPLRSTFMFRRNVIPAGTKRQPEFTFPSLSSAVLSNSDCAFVTAGIQFLRNMNVDLRGIKVILYQNSGGGGGVARDTVGPLILKVFGPVQLHLDLRNRPGGVDASQQLIEA